MEDKDIFVSTFELPKSKNGYQFNNLKFALTRGTYYYGITEKVRSGEIELVDIQSAMQAIALLKHQRADITILSQHTADYYKIREKGLLILDRPHDTFSRHIMFPKSMQQAHAAINSALKKIALIQ